VPQALRLADALLASPLTGIKEVIELTGITFPRRTNSCAASSGRGCSWKSPATRATGAFATPLMSASFSTTSDSLV